MLKMRSFDSKLFGLLFCSAELIRQGQALEAPCYGYGNIMGSPSIVLEDDYEKVVALQVGQGSTYVSYINYLFEGKNHIQLAYLKTDDENYREVSYMHGAKTHVNEKRFTLRNPKSRILQPGIANNDTKS